MENNGKENNPVTDSGKKTLGTNGLEIGQSWVCIECNWVEVYIYGSTLNGTNEINLIEIVHRKQWVSVTRCWNKRNFYAMYYVSSFRASQSMAETSSVL